MKSHHISFNAHVIPQQYFEYYCHVFNSQQELLTDAFPPHSYIYIINNIPKQLKDIPFHLFFRMADFTHACGCRLTYILK